MKTTGNAQHLASFGKRPPLEGGTSKTTGNGASKKSVPRFYAFPLKYRSQHFMLMIFLPLSHSCKQRIGIPIFLANGFLPKMCCAEPSSIVLLYTDGHPNLRCHD